MRPFKESEDGRLITDPKGVLFMRANAAIDLKNEAAVEPWKHGDVQDAEGLDSSDVWKKNKVCVACDVARS